MFCQLFGRFLEQKEVINHEDYRHIINEQMNVRVRLGTIAVATGMLTEEQVEEINKDQQQFDKRFGDIAVEKEYLSEEQVAELLKKQGDAYLQFVQLLTDMTDIGPKELDDYVEQFRKASGFTEKEMECLKRDDIDSLLPIFVATSRPYIKEVAGLVIRNIMRFISRDFYIEKSIRLKEYEYSHMACQELTGEHNVFIGLAQAEDNGAFLKIASGFSGQEMDDVFEDAYDSVSEFINVTSGLFATALSKEEISVDMEPPLGFVHQKASGDFYVIPLVIEDLKVDLLIAVDSEFTGGEEPLDMGSVKMDPVDSADTGKGRILIVDDSKMSRTMLRAIFERGGYTVVMEAANGLDGVEAYKKYKPDIVTLDITMPKMDGLAALEEILKADPAAKAVMITAAGQQDKLLDALRIGARQFIAKPYSEEEILFNINTILTTEY